MTDLFAEPEGGTPIGADERETLLQTWITGRNDLNEAEQENIVKGAAWARRRRGGKAVDMLSDAYVKRLHKQMFGEVWKWAGTYRQTERNIGIEAYRIIAEVPVLFDDIRYWVEHGTYLRDEIAVRLHHRLTQIHPFPNGNGRLARMIADLLIERLGGEPFSWGGGNFVDIGELRAQYIAALKAADGHDIAPLLGFVRS
jgi:Fic-DOC domain mobile mystery protein B